METNRESSTLAVCENCGAPLRGNALFCNKCGHKIEPAATTGTGPTDNSAEYYYEEKPTSERRPKKARNLIIAAVALLLIVGGLVFYVNYFSVDSLCARGEYLVAYEKASDDQKTSVKAESVAAACSAEVAACMDSYLDYFSKSFVLKDAYYKESSTDNTAFGSLVLCCRGLNANGLWENTYWYFECSHFLDPDYAQMNPDDSKWKMGDTAYYSLDGSDALLLQLTMSNGNHLSADAVQRINRLYNQGKLKNLDPVPFDISYTSHKTSNPITTTTQQQNTNWNYADWDDDNADEEGVDYFQTKTGYATDALNVRRDASTKHARVGLLKKGTSVTIVGESGDFWEIEYSWSADGQSGSTAFVHKDYVRIESDDAGYSGQATSPRTTRAQTRSATRAGYTTRATTTPRAGYTTRATTKATTKATTRATTKAATTAKTTMTTKPTQPFVSDKDFVVAVDQAAGCAGQDVKVNFVVNKNSGIWATALDVTYDTSILTLKSVSFGPGLSELGFLSVDKYAEAFQLNGTPSSYDNVTDTGIMATATFEIASNARVGSVAKINVSFNPNNIIDADGDNVSTAVRGGSVIVVG